MHINAIHVHHTHTISKISPSLISPIHTLPSRRLWVELASGYAHRCVCARMYQNFHSAKNFTEIFFSPTACIGEIFSWQKLPRIQYIYNIIILLINTTLDTCNDTIYDNRCAIAILVQYAVHVQRIQILMWFCDNPLHGWTKISQV